MTTDLRSTTSLTLSYEGPALVQGSMSARDLGPALQAIGDLFDRASVLVFREEVDVDVQVRATRQGSFEIDLTLELLRLTFSLLGSSSTTAAVNLVQIVMLAIAILKRMRGDRPLSPPPEAQPTVQAEPYDDVESSRFTLNVSDALGDLGVDIDASDDTVREIALESLSLVRDRQAVQHIQRVAEPVRRNGVDRATIRRADGVTESIEEEDLPSFGPFPEDYESVNTTVIRQWLTLVSPNLINIDGRWRLWDGQRVNWYAILDYDFVSDVTDGIIAFRAHDALYCEVRQTQRIDSDGKLTADFEITRVLDHRSMREGGTQLRF